MEILSDFYGPVFYILSMGLVLILLWNGRKSVKLEYLGVILLIAISALRFDVGSDYDNYYRILEKISDALNKHSLWDVLSDSWQLGMEPSYILFVYPFKNLPSAPIYFFAVYSILNILIIYKALKAEGSRNAVFWGFFAFITLGFLFTSFNQVRQSLAIAVFLYSIQYIRKGEAKKYAICMIIAFLCHFSAILVCWAYLLRRLKPRVWLYTVIVVLLYIGAILGIWERTLSVVYNSVSMYEKYQAISGATGHDAGVFKSGLTMIFRVVLSTYLMIVVAKKSPLLSNLLFLGSVIFILGMGNMGITRIANYLYYTMIFVIPIYVIIEKSFWRSVVIFAMIGYYAVSLIVPSYHVPYNSIFTESFEKKHFRTRDYRK